MHMNSGARKPDDIMAEYLLGGAKMLAELCPQCGAPMFEVKGKRMCVVCADAQNTQTPVVTAAVPAKSVPVAGDIPAKLDALILQFCVRAENEPDPSRCLSYMECIRTAAEARVMLNR